LQAKGDGGGARLLRATGGDRGQLKGDPDGGNWKSDPAGGVWKSTPAGRNWKGTPDTRDWKGHPGRAPRTGAVAPPAHCEKRAQRATKQSGCIGAEPTRPSRGLRSCSRDCFVAALLAMSRDGAPRVFAAPPTNH